MLKYTSMIVELPVFSFSSVSFSFMYFETLVLSMETFIIIIYHYKVTGMFSLFIFSVSIDIIGFWSLAIYFLFFLSVFFFIFLILLYRYFLDLLNVFQYSIFSVWSMFLYWLFSFTLLYFSSGFSRNHNIYSQFITIYLDLMLCHFMEKKKWEFCNHYCSIFPLLFLLTHYYYFIYSTYTINPMIWLQICEILYIHINCSIVYNTKTKETT